ncbi:MAG: metallophosphoesterase [Absicoccus sp.]|uniref:Metallophosphoesterase n=1 Tax=Absicoccus intestinalis TaxID=2926319 RepID=A0ABU4WRN7_9FIRM|nr:MULTISPECIES: metallophosphoesterase [unclassified Absicoccus]MDX8418049.1 metallophosphoesterase [Absicoccus sp. CLA-KB-P134]MDY3036594.1 metallophosphoesterase [Absicoccus sp.]
MIYVTGDIHAWIDISKLNRCPAKANDYLIICGDFGLIWDPFSTKEEEYWLEWLHKKPWTTLFVDGNHENFDRLGSYPKEEKFQGTVQPIYPDIYHLLRGEIYTIENHTIFTFGGAFSHDRDYRIEGKSWWPQELPTQRECQHGLDNLKKYDDIVDIIITHDAPKKVALRHGFDREAMDNGYPANRVNILTYLEQIYETITYQQWYCGHYHIDEDDSSSFHFLYQDIYPILC